MKKLIYKRQEWYHQISVLYRVFILSDLVFGTKRYLSLNYKIKLNNPKKFRVIELGVLSD